MTRIYKCVPIDEMGTYCSINKWYIKRVKTVKCFIRNFFGHSHVDFIFQCLSERHHSQSLYCSMN